MKKVEVFMKKFKRIMALILAVFLFSLYGLTFVVSITGGPNQSNLLMACIYSTVVIPILLWTYNLIYRILKRDSSSKPEETPTKSSPEEDNT